MFCTTGILLRRMSAAGAGLEGVTHVVIDEVHERDLDTDFLLVLVRRLVRAAPKDVRVTLMSATVNAALFAEYFAVPELGPRGTVPVLEVQGRMFPVNEIYLEEALEGANGLEHATTPKRRQTQAEHFASADSRHEPELSRQLLEAAAERADPITAEVLQGPHCQNENISASVVAAVCTWLVLKDPLGGSPPPAAAEAAAADFTEQVVASAHADYSPCGFFFLGGVFSAWPGARGRSTSLPARRVGSGSRFRTADMSSTSPKQVPLRPPACPPVTTSR
jgi:hypothetical protein